MDGNGVYHICLQSLSLTFEWDGFTPKILYVLDTGFVERFVKPGIDEDGEEIEEVHFKLINKFIQVKTGDVVAQSAHSANPQQLLRSLYSKLHIALHSLFWGGHFCSLWTQVLVNWEM